MKTTVGPEKLLDKLEVGGGSDGELEGRGASGAESFGGVCGQVVAAMGAGSGGVDVAPPVAVEHHLDDGDETEDAYGGDEDPDHGSGG